MKVANSGLNSLPRSDSKAYGNNSGKRKTNDLVIRKGPNQIKKRNVIEFNSNNANSPPKDVKKVHTQHLNNDYPNKIYNSPAQKYQYPSENKSSLNKIKSIESINSLAKNIKEEKFKQEKQDIEESKVSINQKYIKTSQLDEGNVNLDIFLKENISLKEENDSLKEENISLKEENKLLQSKINELHAEIFSLNSKISILTLKLDQNSQINLKIYRIFNLNQDDSPKIHKENLKIQSIDSLNIVNHHNHIASFQKNNAMLSNELKQMKLPHDDMKTKFIEEKVQLEKELEHLKYKSNELQKIVDSNIDPNFEILKIEFKEIRRNYDLLAAHSEEQKKKILEIETGVTEDVKQHIRELEGTISRMQNEKDELRTKLMIALMS